MGHLVPQINHQKKKNGAMLYKKTDQFPTSGLYNVSLSYKVLESAIP